MARTCVRWRILTQPGPLNFFECDLGSNGTCSGVRKSAPSAVTKQTSNICIKPLRLLMELKHVQMLEKYCKPKTVHISSLAHAETCFMMIRGIGRRPTKTNTFHKPYLNQGQTAFHECAASLCVNLRLCISHFWQLPKRVL